METPESDAFTRTDIEPVVFDAELLPVENSARYPAPAWARDLAICEINPRGFTSPHGAGDGSGSGTFRSAAARMPDLAQVGVNAIWLAGYHVATDHFYGVWSAYALKDVTRFDPSLGTDADFTHLIDTAHANGIRVLLEVISHGMLNESPVVAEHPDWFLPYGSWGMKDYDYANAEFRRWWVELWVRMIVDFEVDGFRIDLGLGDAALWDEIAAAAAAAGHPIVIICERERYHMAQNDWPSLSPDIAAEWDGAEDRFRSQQLSAHDEGWSSRPGNHYRVRGSRAWFGYGAAFSHRVPLWFSGEEFDAEQLSLPATRRGLFGAGGPGGWLYGSQLDWAQRDDPKRRAFMDDVSRMFAIRREHRDLLNCDRWMNQLIALEASGEVPVVPYARVRSGEKAIVVAGNDTDAPISLRVAVDPEKLGFDRAGLLTIEDLWHGGTRVVSVAELTAGLPLEIDGDHTPGGGVAVLLITPASE